MANLQVTPDITAFVVARLKDAEPEVRTDEEVDRHLARCEMADRHRLQSSWLVPPGHCGFDGERWRTRLRQELGSLSLADCQSSARQ